MQWPFDLARWAFEETVRGALPPEEPEILRFLGGVGWRLERGLTPARAQLTADEVRRTFAVNVRTAGAIVREAQDLALQARMEALVLPRMRPADLRAIVRVQGTVVPPAVVVYPHAGNLLLLAAALAQSWPGLVVFGARGLPPANRNAVGPVRRTRINRWLASRRASEEDRLPIRWETDPDALPGWLARGHLVAAAFDDRAWRHYVRAPLLGREALLSPEPFALARTAGVPLLPATIRRERDKSSRVVLGAPIAPDLGRYLAEHAEPFLREHPGHYAAWLAECRMRAGMDDHPLFTDHGLGARSSGWPVLTGSGSVD
jgi:lauroyl/myristoyl acyltransferase